MRGAAAGMLLGLVLLGAGAQAAARAAAHADPVAAWQRYLDEEASAEPGLRFPYEDCFRRSAAAYGLPLSLLLAIARGESDFDSNARSHANAHGLMQILWPGTAHHLGIRRLSQLYDPCTNVDAGARYLVELLERYDGDVHLSLAAYNYGPHRIRTDGLGVPDGASWYSGYIYRHLRYVLGERNPSGLPAAPREYLADGKLQLAVFAAPFRASAFVDTLTRAAPALRLDWFRADVDKFRVVLLFDSASDLERSRSLLANVGFPVR